MAIVDLAHLRREPRLDVDAVGDVADRHVIFAALGIEAAPHRPRHLAVQRRHGVGAVAGSQGQHRHAERLVAVVRVDAAEAHELVAIEAERFAQRSEVLVDEPRAEAVVPGRHRRVRREHDLCGDAAERFPDVDALDDHPLPHELERREGAVALVEVQHAGRDAQGGKRAHAADAEQQFLADADALVAAVEPRRQLAIFGLVAVDVRIEQQQRVAADRQLPDARGNRAGAGLDRDRDGDAVAQRRPHRQRSVIDVDVVLLLPAVAIEPLPEVALVVVEADADERDAEIRRALDVIAGEDAEAAGIDRQRLVEAELGREVGDRARPQHAGVACAPGVRRVQILLHPAVGVVDAAVQRELRGPLLEFVDRDLLQQRHRIVVERPPQHGIELAEEAGRVRIPAPPQVLRERAEPLVRRRDELSERARLADDRRQLRAGHRQQPHVFGAEGAGVDRLDDEDALQQAAIDDRHAEERAIGILARLGKVLEARMRRGIGDELRLGALGHQAGEALGQAHADAADALGAQADRRREHEVRAIGLEQVDRADVGVEPPLDQVDDVVEGLRGVAARRDQPPDFLERPQCGIFVPCHVSAAHHASKS